MSGSSAIASALAAYGAQRFEEAEELCSRAIQESPNDADVWHLAGLVAYRMGKYELAGEHLSKATKADPDNPHFWLNAAVVALAQGQFVQATADALRAVTLNPSDAKARTILGDALSNAGTSIAAMQAYRRAIEIDPANANAYNNLGLLLLEQRKFSHAVAAFSAAIKARPSFAQAYNNLGRAYLGLDQFAEAVETFRNALVHNHDYALAHYNLGTALLKIGQLAEAEAAFQNAANATPSPDHKRIGEGMLSLNRFADAAECLERGVRAGSHDASAYIALGRARYHCNQLTESGRALRHALELVPDSIEALELMAQVCRRMNNIPGAVEYLGAARRLKPGSADIESLSYYYKQMLCDWSGFEEQLSALKKAIAGGDRVMLPPVAHAVPGLGEDRHLEIALAHAESIAAQVHASSPHYAASGPRIRVGYLSADLFDHPVGRHIVGFLEQHDRERFEILGYSIGPDDHSETAGRLRGSFDNFVDLQNCADDVAAEKIRQNGVDILIDLGGYTERTRPGIPAHRAAPVQALYLGQGGTTGAPYMDYVITDRIVTPFTQARYYSEALAYLPDVYINAEPQWQSHIPAIVRRSDLRLPEGTFVFCAFCSPYKITPDVFDVWMRLLREIPDSVLWLRKLSRIAMANLCREAEARGVSAARLVYAPSVPRAHHIARMACADLFLDTLPYNGASTTADALMAGLPVLTCMGETYVSRTAASMLAAVGLGDLVTTSLDSYFSVAHELASIPDKLRDVSRRLVVNSTKSTLFNPQVFARQLEAIYSEMTRRFRRGLPASLLDIAQDSSTVAL